MSLTPFKSTSLRRRNHSGFTLIEVLVTVVVVSIGLLGLAGLQINGLRASVSSEARSKATLVASDIIERMRANPLGVASSSYANINTAGIGCGAQPNPFCSNTSSTVADNCTPAEMAAFDAWVWACGMPVANGVQPGGVTNQLNQGTGRVVCDSVPCVAGSTYTVTIGWNETNLNTGVAGSAGVDTTQNISLVVVP